MSLHNRNKFHMIVLNHMRSTSQIIVSCFDEHKDLFYANKINQGVVIHWYFYRELVVLKTNVIQ